MRLAPHVPAAPLQRLIVRMKDGLGMTWHEFGQRVGITSRTLQRAMASKTIGIYAADHMAVRLGSHPILLWPDEWGAAAIETCRKGGGRHGEASPHQGREAAARAG